MKRGLPFLLLTTLIPGCGTDVSGPSVSLITCAFGTPTSVATGAVLQVRGSAGETTCITVDDGDVGEFVYIPFFGAAPAGEDEPEISLALELHLLGPGARTAGASSSLHERAPARTAADPGITPDPRFHDWLRQREIEELTPLIGAPQQPAAARLDRSSPDTAMAVPQPGDLRTYNVAISCSREDLRTGRVMHVSEHAIVVADTENPAGLTPQDYAYFGITFDTLVYPVETAHFGVPGDIDGNGRSILFFTRAVNQLNRRNAQSVTIGFFWSGDLFPTQAMGRLEACPAANQAEIFYLLAPDPRGVAGPEFTLEKVRRLAIPLIGHEFQHLVNASRRLYVNDALAFEEPWLNEGLSHAAEELLFYEAGGLRPLQNLTPDAIRAAPNGVTAYNEYMAGNVGNFQRYLSRPDTASLMGPDRLATRGAAWSFLRYAADRTGRGDQAFFFDVVNSRMAGLENLAGAIGADPPTDWMRDWTVSVYADDFVPGIAERFTMPSWDLRALYDELEDQFYSIKFVSLTANKPAAIELVPGRAIYTRFGVAGGEHAILHARSDRRSLPGELQGSLLRVR